MDSGFFFGLSPHCFFGLSFCAILSIKPLLCLRFTDVLLSGFEEQRFGELDCNATYLAAQVVNPTHPAGTVEKDQIEGIAGVKTWDSKAGGYQFARIRTVFIPMAKKRHATAGNVKHLAGKSSFIGIVGILKIPAITQSLLFPLVLDVAHP